MLVIVKSAPDTTDGRRGIKLARDMAADVVLLQNGVYFAEEERLQGFCGAAYVLDDDTRLRGLKDGEIKKDVRKLTYADLVDMMAKEDNVVGMF
ncbi:MAG TPA: DsrH/TusB family sulfur metabolism protein [Thermodesulfovibrionales bacterium]|nr:DsrH/TusB family sulfur metabolism protein [Thermodesulfovibrionales bacterium]